MASTSGGGSTKQLKQVLGFTDLLSTAIGQIIGAGIMTLMGSAIVNLSAEAKKPTRDIPFAIITSTLIVAGLYALISVVASGILPVDEVAGKAMDLVANEILPKPAYAFFMVCGAMFALISTLNAQYAWATKPIMQACDDGWLPKKLAYLHPKHKTPVVLLVILYVVAVISVLSGLDVSVLGNLSLVVINVIFLMISAFMWRLPKVAPEAWAKSKFHVSDGVMKLLVAFSSVCAIITVYLNAIQLSTPLLIGNICAIAAAFLFALLRRKHAQMDISYEEVN